MTLTQATTGAAADNVQWSLATKPPGEPGIYSIREGGFARYQDNIWFRGENTPRLALKTQMISATLKPSQRIEGEQDWCRYSGFSVDAFGEPRAIKRDRTPSKAAPRKMKSRFDTEKEAAEYKEKHQLVSKVVEPMSGGKFGLVFPIAAHVTVIDSAGMVVKQYTPRPRGQGECK